MCNLNSMAINEILLADFFEMSPCDIIDIIDICRLFSTTKTLNAHILVSLLQMFESYKNQSCTSLSVQFVLSVFLVNLGFPFNWPYTGLLHPDDHFCSPSANNVEILFCVTVRYLLTVSELYQLDISHSLMSTPPEFGPAMTNG